MTFEFTRRERERVLSWFKGNANQPLIEIEARIKDVSSLGFDTVLRLYDAEGGSGGVSRSCGADVVSGGDGSLACDDDGGTDLTSLIRYTATSGERLVVVVDGYSAGSAGDYYLTIEEC